MAAGTLEHYLNGQLVTEPAGWRDLTEEIERDFRQRIVASKYPSDVTFTTDGYKLLRDLWDVSFCGDIPYVVVQEVGEGLRMEVMRGTVILSDVEWNLSRGEAKCAIADDGYGARIYNNRSIKVYPTSDASKNNTPITPVTGIELDVFDPADPLNTYEGQTRTVYDWLDCITHCVQYITDGAVSVRSDWYTGLPDDEKTALAYGRELRTGDGSSLAPQMSFEELFEHAWKSDNLWAYVTRNAYGDPELRIEDEATMYGEAQAVAFPNQDELEQAIDGQLLYQKVRFGSPEFIKDEDSDYSLPYLILRGFTEEEYHLLGTCNTDEVLDLIGPFITDTNVIEALVVDGDTDHDNAVFAIQYTESASEATKGDYLNPGNNPYLYNERYQNVQVAARWPLYAEGVIRYEEPDAVFRAQYTVGPDTTYTDTQLGSNTVPAGPTIQSQFDNDYSGLNFDTGGNYGNGTVQGNPVSRANSRYTFPAQGFYQFQVAQVWEITANARPDKGARLQLYMEHYNSSNTLINTYLEPFAQPPDYKFGLGAYVNVWDQGVSASTGDYVIVKHRWFTNTVNFTGVASSISVRVANLSYWQTTFVATGGGDIGSATDADEYRCVLLNFDRHIDPDQWLDIAEDPTGRILVAQDDSAFRWGHVRKASRKVHSGETSWELICNRDQPLK